MLYTETIKNIYSLLKQTKCASVEQLQIMFSDVPDHTRVRYYIQTLVKRRYIVEDENYENVYLQDLVLKNQDGKLTFDSICNIEKYQWDEVIKLLWIPTYIKSTKIRAIRLTNVNPPRIHFILQNEGQDDIGYDLLYFSGTSTHAMYNYFMIENHPKWEFADRDNALHFLMADNIELVKEAYKKGYPFNYYCLLDENNVPKYYPYSFTKEELEGV